MLGPRPPSPSPENATPSSPEPQEWLDEVYRAMETGFRAQDAYQMELQKQSATDGPHASPKTIQDSAGVPGLEPGGRRLSGCRHYEVERR